MAERSPGSTLAASPSPPLPVFLLYHERQRLELCAVHSLNNLLQERLFSKEQLDRLCERLAPDSLLNPHRSILGTGNYDVNILIAALLTRDLAAIWWDKRRSLGTLVLSRVLGFILNVPSNVTLGFVSLPIRRKHWVAVRQVDGVYYNLDSKLKSPVRIGSEEEELPEGSNRPGALRVAVRGGEGRGAGRKLAGGSVSARSEAGDRMERERENLSGGGLTPRSPGCLGTKWGLVGGGGGVQKGEG
ncbi:josephin-2 isoform X2 [Heterodontus francisci]|uniref:josephin-2 isoform X2 n=1 Tax=Heterodontus francisci TaxID=7792 RepID=UPI00355B033F